MTELRENGNELKIPRALCSPNRCKAVFRGYPTMQEQAHISLIPTPTYGTSSHRIRNAVGVWVLKAFIMQENSG